MFKSIIQAGSSFAVKLNSIGEDIVLGNYCRLVVLSMLFYLGPAIDVTCCSPPVAYISTECVLLHKCVFCCRIEKRIEKLEFLWVCMDLVCMKFALPQGGCRVLDLCFCAYYQIYSASCLSLPCSARVAGLPNQADKPGTWDSSLTWPSFVSCIFGQILAIQVLISSKGKGQAYEVSQFQGSTIQLLICAHAPLGLASTSGQVRHRVLPPRPCSKCSKTGEVR